MQRDTHKWVCAVPSSKKADVDRFCLEFTFTSNTKEKLALFENLLLPALLL